MEPIADGTIVTYHGSIEELHGEYYIEGSVDPALHRPDLLNYKGQDFLNEVYPDGRCYFLWPVGVEKRLDNPYEGINSVRRSSFTVVASEDGPDPESTLS